MASLYLDQVVWVVKITLTKKDNSGSATYYLSHQYYDEGELYTASPVIYPLLAGNIDNIDISRSVGREVAILHTPTLQIYGKGHLDDYEKSFFDLGEQYSFVEAAVEYRQYIKSFDGTTTHSDSVNIKLASLRVKSVSWSDDVLELGCKQVLFRDKEISKKYDETIFPDMPIDDFYGEYAPIVFGESVVIESPFIASAAMAEWSGALSSIFTGWVATGHPMNAFNQLYARNTENPRDAEWVPITISNSGSLIHGNQYELGLGDADGAVGVSRACVYSPAANSANIAYAVNFGVTRNSATTSVDGFATIVISRAPSMSVAGVWVDEQVLREIKFDQPNTGSLFTAIAYIYPPLVMTENENYLFEYFWSNPTATDYYRLRFLTTGTNANDNGQKRDNATRGAGWEATGNDHYLALYGIMKSGTAWDDSAGTAPNLYSYYDFNCKAWNSLTPSYASSNSDGAIHYGIELKSNVSGLEDDGSGTYTDSANSVIKRPSDIIRFLLLDDELGVNHGSGSLNGTAFDDVRAKLETDSIAMSFAIESETYCSSMVLKILSQSRLVMPINQDGKVSLHYPVNVASTADYYLAHSEYRDDMEVSAVYESSEDAILNDFLVPYGEDKLNTPKDPATIRKIRGSSYKEVEYLNDVESSISDASRVAKAAASIALYGRKLYRTALDLYNATATAPATIMKYLFDRWHMKTTTAVIRLPATEVAGADLFDDCHVSSEHLPSEFGTSNHVNSQDSGTRLVWYNAGVPVKLFQHGQLTGQIQGVRHFGDEIEFTIETVNAFEEAA